MRNCLIAIMLLILSGCGSADKQEETADPAGEKTQTPAEVAEATSSVTLRPGEWEIATEVTDMNIPGMPAGAMPKEAMQKTSLKSCLTPEQTGKPDASFFSGQRNSNCTYEGFEMTAGTVTGTISCPSNEGTQKMTISGQYEPERYDIRMEMASERMSMKMHTTGTRLGDCPAP